MPFPAVVQPSAEPQTLDEILDWHRGIVDALIEQRVSVQTAIRRGLAVAPRFVGMTERDVDIHYDAQRRELDRLTVLNLVASAEATIKLDYFRRVNERLKDSLSRAYREWHNRLSAKQRRRPDFDERGILDVLKGAGVMDNHIVGRYRECLHVRHWLGHGRYWAKPAQVEQLDPDEVFDRANKLLQAIPA
ncbi:MAG TPA: hypothetical protein VMV10_23685 [Pirellulales bacterium]|nr:hypothetical protein [Pirellulales bacterium]